VVDLEFADNSDLGDTLFFFGQSHAGSRKPRNQLEHGFKMVLKGCYGMLTPPTWFGASVQLPFDLINFNRYLSWQFS